MKDPELHIDFGAYVDEDVREVTITYGKLKQRVLFSGKLTREVAALIWKKAERMAELA